VHPVECIVGGVERRVLRGCSGREAMGLGSRALSGQQTRLAHVLCLASRRAEAPAQASARQWPGAVTLTTLVTATPHSQRRACIDSASGMLLQALSSGRSPCRALSL
jgi:hypothetical protein